MVRRLPTNPERDLLEVDQVPIGIHRVESGPGVERRHLVRIGADDEDPGWVVAAQGP